MSSIEDLPFLSLAMIVRNAGAIVDRCLASVLERESGPMVDEIVVVPGGTSTDDTLARIESWRDRSPVPIRIVDMTSEEKARAVDPETGRLTDFSIPRNASFEACRGEWILWLDSDDIVPAPEVVRAFLEARGRKVAPSEATLKDFLRQQPGQINAVWAIYHYLIDGAGNPIVASWRDRILRWRHGFRWVDPIHEHVQPLPGNAWRSVYLGEDRSTYSFWIEHRPEAGELARSRRNAEILEGLRERGQIEWRTAYYLGHTCHDLRDHEKACEWLRLATRLARVDEEAIESYHALFRNARLAGRPDEALAAASQIVGIDPERPEGLADLTIVFGESGRWDRCLVWYDRLLKTAYETAPTTVAYELRLWPHLYASHALLEQGRAEEGLVAAHRARAFASYDADAARQVARAEAACDLKRQTEAARVLVEARLAAGDPEAARLILDRGLPRIGASLHGLRSLLDRMPSVPDRDRILVLARPEDGSDGVRSIEIDRRPGSNGNGGPHWTAWRADRALMEAGLTAVRLEASPDRISIQACRSRPGPAGPDVRIFAPLFAEPYGPFTPERTGIGASEEQIVLVSRLLASEGLRVTVYAPVPELEIDEGVRWEPAEAFHHAAPCDALLLHRAPWVARYERIGARRLFLWPHDVPESYGEAFFLPHLLDRLETVLSLSQAMDRHLAVLRVPPEKIRRLPYLLPDCDLEEPKDLEDRDPTRIFWGSNPYRGLGVVLTLWSRIQERFPAAELHACYGWQVFDSVMRQDPGLHRLRASLTEGLRQPGVYWYDRLPQRKSRDLLRSCGTWWYPSTFPEQYCAMGQACLAGGLLPVVRPIEALEETIPADLAVLCEADPARPEGLSDHLDAILQALDRRPTIEDRRALRARALQRHAESMTLWLAFARDLRAGLGRRSGQDRQMDSALATEEPIQAL